MQRSYVLILALSLIRASCSLNELFLRKDALRSSQSERSRSESLAKLLQRVARDYFDDCVIGVIYDSNYEQSHPIDFHRYFGSTSLAYTQETVDFRMGRKLRLRREEKCTNYIVFLYNIHAIKHVMATNLKSKIVIVSAETPWEIKDFLKSHISKTFMHLLVIVHSTSRKNGDGSYLLYTHRLYAEGSGSTVPLLLGSWINNTIRDVSLNLFPEKLKRGFKGHRLIISTVNNPPYAIRRSRLGAAESRWDGIEVRLLQLAGEYLNFTVEFMEPQSASETISPMESAKRDVTLGLAAAAAGGIYETSDLTGLFDTTTPFAEDCASFISLASTALPKYRAVLGPFQLPVWLMLMFSYFILIIPLSFNSKYTIFTLFTRPSALNNMFWFVFSTYTNSFIVKNPLLQYGVAKNAITVLLGIYWVFTIIITACYTGSIVAFITLPVYPSAIETAQELLYYKYRIGTLDHSGWETWFNVNTTDDPFTKKLFKKIEYVPTLLEGVQNASRAYFWPYAFLASKTSLDYLVQTDFAPTWSTKRTLMHISDECFVRYNVVQLFPAKSLYTKSVSDFVILATETGLVDQIISDIDWEIQRIAMMTNKQITKRVTNKVIIEDRVLTMEDTQGMFLILGSGTLMALLALTIESFTSFWRKRKTITNDEREDEVYWQTQSRVDSWIVRDDPYREIRHRPSRGSV